uniref:Uncharacterized protein n=1 Tax=Panagrolaimus sp. JU765 TaxID=591449 RepID=A0AC34RHS9_9BILA
MQVFLVFALFFVASFATPLNVLDDFEINKKFEEFEKKFSLKFASEAERKHRLSIFRENLEEIEKLNQKYPSATFGITKFATWTKDEFHQKMLMPKNIVPPKTSKVVQFDSSSAPKSPDYFDWRQKNVVTSIKNQEDCGSCWAFSSTAAIESQHAIKTAELVDLSEQQLIDCEWVSQGCNFGFVTPAFEYVKNNGQVLAKDYPYTDNRTKCEKLNTAKRVFIDGHVKIEAKDEAIAAYVASKGPATFGKFFHR